MTSYDQDGSLMGDEIAEYHYDRNDLHNDPNFKVDGTIKNEYGDMIQELKPECLSCDELVIYRYELLYLLPICDGQLSFQ